MFLDSSKSYQRARCRHYTNYRRKTIVKRQKQDPITTQIQVIPKGFQSTCDRLAAEAIFTAGRSYGLFEDPHFQLLFQHLNPRWKPISRDKVSDLLPIVYKDYVNQVRALIRSSQWLNVIIDGSDDIYGNSLLNISIQIPGSAAFYWKTLDTGKDEHTVVNIINMIKPILQDLVEGQFNRINNIVTDSMMQKLHREMKTLPEFAHCFYICCDSHSLQLLIKDIFNIPRWKSILDQTALIIGYFKASKLQLARLHTYQQLIYQQRRSFIIPVITRWGTEYFAISSILRSREALRAFIQDPIIWAEYIQLLQRSQTSQSQEPKLMRVINVIKMSSFWEDLETIGKLLEPIIYQQQQGENDKSHVGHVLEGWERVRSVWLQIQRVGLYTIDFHPLFQALETRRQLQIMDIHTTAFALDPAYVTTKLQYSDMIQVEAFLKKNCTADDWSEIKSQFHDFRAKEGPYFGMDSEIYDLKERPYAVWQRLHNMGFKLAYIAKRLFKSLPTSVPSERSFSHTNFLHNRIRNRLQPENTDMLCFIYINSRILSQLTLPRTPDLDFKIKPDRWDTVKDVVLMEMEDEYLSLNSSLDSELIGEYADVESRLVFTS